MTVAYRWQHLPGQELSLLAGDLVLARYRFATERRKAFLHPLHTVDGALLTCLEPWDHVWHRGVWFAWKYLNGVNYWEERPDAIGRTNFVGNELVALHDTHAVVTSDYTYRPVGGASVIDEKRLVTIRAPDAEGNYRLDWSHTFTARDDAVTIDRTPINDETPWGGYAGLSWRAARSLGNFRSIDSEGRRDGAVEHQRARWADLSGVSDGGVDLAVGIAMFDHPDNPRHPTHWRCILDPGFGYLNAAFVLAAPYTLPGRDSFALRYRALIHQGWGDPAALEREFHEFSLSEAPCAVDGDR